MSVFTYTAANSEMMTTSGQVVTNNANAVIKDVAEQTRTSDSFLSGTSAIQVALWFPTAFLFTGIATAFTITSVILIVMLDLRDKYWPAGIK